MCVCVQCVEVYFQWGEDGYISISRRRVTAGQEIIPKVFYQTRFEEAKATKLRFIYILRVARGIFLSPLLLRTCGLPAAGRGFGHVVGCPGRATKRRTALLGLGLLCILCGNTQPVGGFPTPPTLIAVWEPRACRQ